MQSNRKVCMLGGILARCEFKLFICTCVHCSYFYHEHGEKMKKEMNTGVSPEKEICEKPIQLKSSCDCKSLSGVCCVLQGFQKPWGGGGG